MDPQLQVEIVFAKFVKGLWKLMLACGVVDMGFIGRLGIIL
jgi:hypothetical protein